MTYDDWEDDGPLRYGLPRKGTLPPSTCPIDAGTRREYPSCECDHGSEDIEPSGNPGQLPPIPNPPPRVLCPTGTRGCGQIAAAPGHWWYCSHECRALNKERP